jgi:hypothetical protein
MSSPFLFNQVTPAEIETLIQELRANNTTVTKTGGNSFVISGHGITAQAAYDEPKQTLTVTVTHKPFFVSDDLIESGIRDAIGAAAKT